MIEPLILDARRVLSFATLAARKPANMLLGPEGRKLGSQPAPNAGGFEDLFLSKGCGRKSPITILNCPGGPGAMKWDSSRQFEPIFLVFAEKNNRTVVRTARDAAEVLLRYWPVDDGEQFYDAIKICLDVIVGLTEPDRLREAMIRAAGEAGIAALAVVH